MGSLIPDRSNRQALGKTQVIQAHVHGAKQTNGHTILNHPNFHYMHTASDIRPVEGLHLFELYNGHPSVNNFGDDEHISVEELLGDELLTDGMLIYGVSFDDAHYFQDLSLERSNPGRGWVMARAKHTNARCYCRFDFARRFLCYQWSDLEGVRTRFGP